MAQRQRAGLITPRSLDRDQLLLVIVFGFGLNLNLTGDNIFIYPSLPIHFSSYHFALSIFPQKSTIGFLDQFPALEFCRPTGPPHNLSTSAIEL